MPWRINVNTAGSWQQDGEYPNWTEVVVRARELLKQGPVKLTAVSLGQEYVFESVEELDELTRKLIG